MQFSTPVELKSVEVQTELTWPCAAEQPIHITHVSIRSTAAKSTTTEDVGSGPEDKSKKGGKGKSSHPKITRPPSSSTHPVTDINRYAVLASSQ